MTDYTIKSISKRLHQKLQEYIEAQYPISETSLLLERRRLLESQGVISKEPYIEATPVYEPGEIYTDIKMPKHCQEMMMSLSKMIPDVGVFPRPYVHQKEALESFLEEQKDLVIATGTGSGKTESFLHPILNSLLDEGYKRPEQYKRNAVRALILYPMNALVSDQITRLRKLFGDKRVSNYFEEKCGRHPLFGMYTSRTPYPGERTEKKDKYQLAEIIKYYNEIEENDPNLGEEMKKRGKWIAKDLKKFSRGKRGEWESKYVTVPGDQELFTRHEMQQTPPDILVTNYSMLEYMLMRPIERSIWEETKEWLAQDKENKFILVLDEAHMYRGTSGAEVALLIRRLQARLGIDRDRLQCILTSASLGSDKDDNAATEFAKQLTGKAETREFKLIKGTREKRKAGRIGTTEEANIFANINSDLFTKRIYQYRGLKKHLDELLMQLDWEETPYDIEGLSSYLYKQLDGFGPLETVIASISGNAKKFTEIAESIFPKVEREVAEKATSNLLMLANAAKEKGRVLLPVRIHLFFKGVSGIYVCTNASCNVKRKNDEQSLLGKMYDSSKLKCSCDKGARVYELLTHRKCGSSFIRGYVAKNNQNYLWAEKGFGIVGDELTEIHLLVEKPHSKVWDSSNPPNRVWLDIKTGFLAYNQPSEEEEYLQLYIPNQKSQGKKKNKKQAVITFDQCPCCMRKINGTLQDLKTKGEQPFANIVREQFMLQQPIKKDSSLPNEGRKVLLFSDGRQKAARLARDIPYEVELDSFRQVILLAAQKLISGDEEAKLSGSLYTAVLDVIDKHKVHFFEDEDRKSIMKNVQVFKENFDDDYDELIDDGDVEVLNRFKTELLRQICHPLYSIYATATGFIEPMEKEKRKMKKALKEILSESDIYTITAVFIQELLDSVAIDTTIEPHERIKVKGFNQGTWGVDRGYRSRKLNKVIDMYIEKEEEKEQVVETLYKLCVEHEAKCYLTPKKLKLVPGIEVDWYKCNRCKELNMVVAKGKCINCLSDEIEILSPESTILDSEKGFWRSPINGVINKNEKISNLTVEEHTAQLSQKDPKVALATTEEYELRFQDIILNDLDGAVDVLSCTTTMEVGVDIGSLTAVGLRNVPPQRENYQQRAGRAGRRGSALSTVLTYSQGGPHDHYYFKQPDMIISGASRKPIIYIDNKKIAKRHLNAFFIQTYFHEHVLKDGRTDGVLNSSLGDTKVFFESSSVPSMDGFEEWLKFVTSDLPIYSPVIFNIIPDEVISKMEGSETAAITLKIKIIKEAASQLINDLRENYEGIKHTLIDIEDEDTEHNSNNKFLDFLFNHGMLPTYAFPKDLSSLYIEEWDHISKKVITKQRPQLEINRALSEYAPGKQVVVDKKTYRIGGIFVPTPRNRLKPARDLKIEGLKEVTYCDSCLFVSLDEFDNNQCPVCCSKLKKDSFLRPTGFSPEKGREVREGDREQEFTYAMPPQLPIPVSEEGLNLNTFEDSSLLKYTNALDKKLIVMNKGIDGKSGFEICVDCGAIWVAGEKERKPFHDVPYRLKKEFGQKESQCRGETRKVFLGNVFHSDLLLLRLQFGSDIDFNSEKQWVHDGLKTIGEALVLAASRVLDIDYNELSAGYRLLPLSIGGADIYLFDTLSGGAGYAHIAGTVLKEIIKEARYILADCENNCEKSCYKCLRHYANQFYHNQLNRFVALELLDYVVSGTLKQLSLEEQKEILAPVKRMMEIHKEVYEEIEQDGKYFIKKTDGHLIGAKNNIECRIENQNQIPTRYVSAYEVLYDLPNVYLGSEDGSKVMS
ncbi:DEAD/DEAH box helicase [Bacillus cereus]|uniref:DEAD/DEAH box helicase n=1 Tax=Bacillus cereus TaxID=1396 RepID=UPI002228066D|nr:DEAD/DEAH box helicase [Bacillus cereus]UYY94838.1 DEAD/DEAH box helicase [Bacillus cereus]